jgi:1-acyl-sn-glycerol-3-phosphate acyltransferase
MIEYLENFFSIKPPEAKLEEIIFELNRRYPDGKDPWGLDLKIAKKSLQILYPFYSNYFKVRIFGEEKIKDKPYMVISNHSGQVAIDAMLISMAFSLEISPPRLLRPMVDRFVVGLPFFGEWSAQTGAVLGDRQNCMKLMEKKESILVFPEGLKGITKNTSEFYKLQEFTDGFYRLALSSGYDIVPIAVIGCEEFFPFVYHLKSVAKSLGLPALPLMPNLFPLPSPVDIYIGDPISLPKNLSPDAPDKEIKIHVNEIKRKMASMIKKGLKNQRTFWSNKGN